MTRRPPALAMSSERLDAIIVGAGPAGLTAALYMGRFRRRVLVIDGGDSRAAWIPITHNHPGFPQGVAGAVLLDLQRDHALRYGARSSAAPSRCCRFWTTASPCDSGAETLRAATVLLACGVEDNAPPCPGRRGRPPDLAAHLPDLRRVRGHRPARGRDRPRPAGRARGPVPAHLCRPADLDPHRRAGRPARRGTGATGPSRRDGDRDDDRQRRAPARPASRPVLLRCRARGVRRPLQRPGRDAAHRPGPGGGARHDDQGRLVVDDHQQTSIPGLYAAGDMVRGLNQITTAQGEAAIAATAMHNRLRGV
jgi:thioredoxin reductase (NADPH)